MDLPSIDGSPGLGKQAEIWRRFGLPVVFSPGGGLKEFFLVISVGRCKFRLTEDSIAHLLQAILGGNARSFNVVCLKDRVYRFSVSSKQVGFFIYNLRSYECDSFKVQFHLWSDGGLRSESESQRWEREQEAEWIKVVNKKKIKKQQRSYADAVRLQKEVRPLPLTGANSVPIRAKQQSQANQSKRKVNQGPKKQTQVYRRKVTTTSGPQQSGPIGQQQAENRTIVNASHGNSSPTRICLDLQLCTQKSQLCTVQETEKPTTQENPSQPPPSPQLLSSFGAGTMAFRHIDPAPHIPPGFARTVVPGRATMVCAIGGRRPPRNEDMAIVAIDPMPMQHVHFNNIRDVLGEFFRDHMRVKVRDIQPCPFAQAYVRFDRISDRDRLVLASPHLFDNVYIYLANHDKGPNRRRVQYNHECWLILIGFPLDYWTREHIATAISSFGKLEVWEQDLDNLARVMIKAKVVDLVSVPKWIVISEGGNQEGESWTVQCEIIHRKLLGEQAQDEDPVPEDNPNIDLVPFDFFGYGQMEPGHVFGMPVPEEFVDEEIIAKPEIPDQPPEPVHQISLSVSLGSSAGSVSSNVVQQNMQADEEMNVQPLPAIGNNPPHVLPNLNIQVEANILQQPELDVADLPEQQIVHEPLPDLNIAEPDNVQIVAMQIDQEPVLPDMNLEVIIGEEGVVGFVHIEDEHNADPVFQALVEGNAVKKPFNADTIRLWAKYFSPTCNFDATVEVPSEWMLFFTNVLLSPTHYSWAKIFLSSQAWQIFQKQPFAHSMPYLLPGKCPTDAAPSCSYLEMPSDDNISADEDDTADDTSGMSTPKKQFIHQVGLSESTSAVHRNRKRQRQVPVVETDCRRSERIKDITKGFKRSMCPHRDCFACAGAPPTLSPVVIKELGDKLCKVGPEALSEAALSTRKTKKTAVKKVAVKKHEERKTSSKDSKESTNGRKPSKKEEK
ncbi:hypothetical protein EJB05_36948, partial [Eragrostis curvula]